MALALYGPTTVSAALRHEIPIEIMDPLLWLEEAGAATVLTSALERERIARVRPDATLLDAFDLGLRELRLAGMPADEAEREVAVRAVLGAGVEEVIVPGDFPVGLADRLRDRGIGLRVDDTTFAERRRVKTGPELAGVRAAQVAAETAMAAAAALLGRAQPDGDGRLRVAGEALRAEDVRAVLRASCGEAGCRLPPDVIVGSLWSGYGHDPGSGPLPAGLPIVIDIWPREEASGCWADMTRTFRVGAPATGSAEIVAELERLVTDALEVARAGVRPGALGSDLYGAVCDAFEAAGRRTPRSDATPGNRDGFRFALGHGVGLEVHEPPGLGLTGNEPLVAGDVLALEPGLWDDRVGEVRLEDLVLVTADGCETLTAFPYAIDVGPGG